MATKVRIELEEDIALWLKSAMEERLLKENVDVRRQDLMEDILNSQSVIVKLVGALNASKDGHMA
jgi:hypothetical protein